MFDAQSSILLRQAPEIPGLSPEDLPQLLTDIYTEIVVSRLKADNAALETKPVLRLMEIANSYEAITALIEDDQLRKASAFVSGSAYQILAKSTEINQNGETVPLSRDHIDGRLAAALLFLVAEQYPDSKESIDGFFIPQENYPVILQMLCESLRDLVLEKYQVILDRAARRGKFNNFLGELQDRATLKLYENILQGVEFLAAKIMASETYSAAAAQYDSPETIFTSVLNLCSFQHRNETFGTRLITTYPGPAHLAGLLISASAVLEKASVLKVVSPGVDTQEKWQEWLRHRAVSKPILWPNHRTAINQGFHFQGTSSVIVLPTGAGKTTMAEFKIAGVLANDKKVIFLAPTNALVEQLQKDLREALPESIFGENNEFESDFFFSGEDTLSSLEVMTPEKCLALLNFNPDAFCDVGLLVFDECHMLSPSAGSLRRAIDSMLTVLTFQRYAPEADYLFLSAMVKNVEEFAEWIGSLTGRNCLSINMIWKPSRQARGILLYQKEELNAAIEAATQAQQIADDEALAAGRKKSKGVRTAPGRLLKAIPYALFGLVHNWNVNDSEDIRIKKISDTEYALDPKFGPRRIIEPASNGTVIARNLAIASVKCGYKTIVFINTANSTYTSAREIQKSLPDNVDYTPHEISLLNAIESEIGSLSNSMLENLKSAVPHNARLLGFERRLSESLYQRPEGASVIFATTTLSQGMNLPAQVAILSADKRASHDEDRDGYSQDSLHAHELLNAAGRAGRAGFLANGLVFLIPRTVLKFTGATPENKAFPILESIIPEDEQCVTIIDSVERILDQIQIGGEPSDDIVYMFHRLLPEKPESNASETLIKRSFGRFIAEKQNDTDSFDEKIERFKQAIAKIPRQENMPDWISKLTIQSGLSLQLMMSLYEAIKDQFQELPENVKKWSEWIIGFLKAYPEAGHYCFGKLLLPLEKVGGITIKNHEHYERALDTLQTGIYYWISGEPIREIDRRMGGTLKGRDQVCPRTRELVTNILPRQLSYFASLVVQITKNLSEETETPILAIGALECLPNALKHGFDMPEKLAFYTIQRKQDTYLTRVEAHRMYVTRFGNLDFSGDNYKTIFTTVKELIDLL